MAIDREHAIVTLEEYEPQLWTCVNCFCGFCIESCPVFIEGRNEVGAARGMGQLGLALLSGELELSDIVDDIAYACTGCRWCEWNCSLNKPLFIERTGTRRTKVSGATMAEIFRSMRAEQGKVPKEVRNALNNLANVGNPYGGSKQAKDKWVADLGVSMEKTDTILYVGATIPYEDRATKMAEAIVDVLRAFQIDIGMLGGKEMDSGAFAMMMGEEGLFADMTEQTEKMMKTQGVKQIICVSPHDYDAFLTYYPALDGLEIKHYTQLFAELIDSGKIKLSKEIKKKVTYHDPCYLGRKNNIYDEPRKILQSIPGVELVEMDKTKETAYCCGGGGTGLFYDLPKMNMNLARADQAKEKDVGCMAVACPICLQMLDDGIKSRDYKFEVNDIAQLVREAL